MWVPSAKVISLICSCSKVWLLWLSVSPWAQRDPVASHLDVSSYSSLYWLKRCSIFSCILRTWVGPAAMLTSNA